MNIITAIFLLITSLCYAELPDDVFLVEGCNIYRSAGGKVESFPGSFCAFLLDGRVISASNDSIRMLGPAQEVLWELKAEVHHQLNLSEDRKRILTLLSENIDSPKGKIRKDKLTVISLDGKILHEARVDELLKDKLNFVSYDRGEITRATAGPYLEDSHFNSIYEIPQNSSKLPFLKPGNIIVNSVGHGVCVISGDLKQVFDCRKFSHSLDHHVHDVQVTAQGTYLYFNNEFPDKIELHSSSVEELDPATGKIVFRFQSEPKIMFYSPGCGGVQVLDKKHLLISHMQAGIFIIDRQTKKGVGHIPFIALEPVHLKVSQQIKARRLGEFFSARKVKLK